MNNLPKISATLDDEFGNAHSVKANVEQALIDLYIGVCADRNISEFRNDIIVNFEMRPQTNKQVLPTVVKATPLFSEKTAIVHVDYSNKTFTDESGQPHKKPNYSKVLTAVITGLVGADMVAKDRYNGNNQPSGTYKDKLKPFGVKLTTKDSDGKAKTELNSVKAIIDPLSKKFAKQLEIIASIPVASTYKRPKANDNDDPMVKIVCSLDCVASDIRISVKQSQLSIIGATLGKCETCSQAFVSEETQQATNQPSIKNVATDLIKSVS